LYHALGTSKTPGLSSIRVDDAFDVKDIEVTMEANHRRIGALNIFMTTADETGQKTGSVVLKQRGLGRLGNDLIGVKFNDAASSFFPEEAENAPFTGTWMPSESFHTLIEGDDTKAGSGGSKGIWTLHLEDVAPNADERPIFLRKWSLKLCGETGVAAADDQPAVTAQSGPVGTRDPSTVTSGTSTTIQGSPFFQTGRFPTSSGDFFGAAPGTVMGSVIPEDYRGIMSEHHATIARVVFMYLYGTAWTQMHIALLDHHLERTIFMMKDVFGLEGPKIAAMQALHTHISNYIADKEVFTGITDLIFGNKLANLLGIDLTSQQGGLLGGLNVPQLGDFLSGTNLLSNVGEVINGGIFGGLLGA